MPCDNAMNQSRRHPNPRPKRRPHRPRHSRRPQPASADEVKPASETPDEEGRPSLLNRRRKPKDKGRDDLFNPDDDDYL